MPKIRVYELAKELSISNKEMLSKLESRGIEIKNHMSSIDEEVANKFRTKSENKEKTQEVSVKMPSASNAQKQESNDAPTKQVSEKVDAEPSKPSAEKQETPSLNNSQNINNERPEGQRSPRPRPVGPDGRPLPPRLGPDGRPLPRPVGPDGKPLPPRPRPLGPDGKPLPRPLGPDGKPLPPRPRPVGPDGKPLPLRPRLGPDGKPLPRPLGPNGRPLRPRPLGPDGKPVPRPRPDRPVSGRPNNEGSDQATSGGSAERPPFNRQNQDRPNNQRTGDGFRPQGDRPPRGDRPPFENRPPRENRPNQEGRPFSSDRPPRDGRPPGQNRPDSRPFRDGAKPGGGFTPGQKGNFSGPRPPRDGSKPGMQTGRPAPQGGGRPGGGPGGRGAPPQRATTEVKKTEPTKDDKRGQWMRQQQAISINRSKKENERKENRDALDKKRAGKGGKGKKEIIPKIAPSVSIITVQSEITVRDLAEKLMRSNADIIKVLMKKGLMVTANQTIDFETASFVAESFNVLVEEYIEEDLFEKAFASGPDEEASLTARPPVVVVMGHVDHGKTSLLDVIRNANVQQSEAGGITQHIGAYSVQIHDKRITFLDTPGHEAFTAMRMRGAQVTDIAILVVAADDGVMPQTIEAINHAKAAEVEIIVAITMMDKPDANPDRVRQQLTDHGLQPEEWGGSTITVPVSAKQQTGIENLLEMILLVSEMKELTANPNKPAKGSIVEAKLDKGRGPVATVLVQEGTLRVGDPVVAGAAYGKIRAMVDSRGQNLKEAGPSMPVEIIGLAEVPTTGDIIYAAQNEKQARQLSESVVAKGRENLIKKDTKVTLDQLFSQIQAGQVKDLNVVVKADVQGSVEALKGSLEKLTNPEVRVRIIHTGVGAISESDVMLASASNAIILGFNVRPDAGAKIVAENEQVDLRMYSVIYAAIDDIDAAMKGMLDPEFREKLLGHAEIRQIFRASGIGVIGGCYVTDGRITRNAQVRLVRDGRVIYDGYLDTLKRFKDDVREVNTGYECGMLFRNYNDIKEGDKVEAYVMEEIPR